MIDEKQKEAEKLSDLILEASKKAFLDLFSNGEQYYYCVLITSGEAFFPYISACSVESLSRYSKEHSEEDAKKIKWSYADSEYCSFGYELYFKSVELYFQERLSIDDIDDDAWEEEFNLRIFAMERAMKRLDNEGFFSLNQARKNIIINVEVMPPDSTNTDRALRLNERENIIEWLKEVAE